MQATTGHSSDLGTFWNSSLNWGLPFLGDQGRLDLGQLAVPDWVAGHPAALMTVRLFGSVLFSFIAVRVIDWLAYIASEKVRQMPGRVMKHMLCFFQNTSRMEPHADSQVVGLRIIVELLLLSCSCSCRPAFLQLLLPA